MKIQDSIPILAASLLFAGCHMEIPQKVSIKTNARYSFQAGPVMEKDFSDIFSVGKIQEMVKDIDLNGNKAAVYDYNPGGNSPVQAYLLNLPVMEIPIDIGSYLKDMDFSTMVENMSFEQEIVIPKMDIGEIGKVPIPGTTGSQTVSIPLPEIKTPLEDDNSITYKSGSLVITLTPEKNVPQAFATTVKATLTDSGGKTSSSENAASKGKNPIVIRIPLDGMTLAKTFKLAFDASSSGGDFTTAYNFAASIKSEGEEIATAAVNLSDLAGKLAAKQENPFPADMSNYMESMTLEKAGIEVKYTNTLPQGNDIGITAKSALFKLEKTGSIESGVGTEKALNLYNETENKIEINGDRKIDFAVSMTLPKADDANPTHTILSNIEPGKKYEISVAVTPVFEWKEVALKLSSLDGVKGTTDTGIDMKDMFSGIAEDNDDFTKNIGLARLPLYMYASAPTGVETFKNIAFTGSVKINGEELLPKASGEENGRMEIKPLHPLNPYKKSMVTTVLPEVGSEEYSASKDIAKILKNGGTGGAGKDGGLTLDYDLKISGVGQSAITIKKEELEKDDGAKNIAIVMRMVLPLELKVDKNESGDDAFIDIKKLAGLGDGDLFGRSEKTDISNIDEYLGAVKSAAISFNMGGDFFTYKAKDGVSYMNISIGDDMKFNLPGDNKEKTKLEIKTEDLRSILEKHPYSPSVRMTIPEGTLSIPRKAGIKMQLGLQVQMDGENPIPIL